MINLLTALPCEAAPLIQHFKLRRQSETPYASYRNDRLTLVVSGSGKLAAATACGWLQHAVGADTAGWLNIGIGGHADLALGHGLLADKVTEQSSGRRWYPTFTARPQCTTTALICVDQPQTNYHDKAVYDMESAGYFAAVQRFAPSELSHCFKVVSDNCHSGIENINKAWVSDLIAAQRHTIGEIIDQLQGQTARLNELNRDPGHYADCLQRWHFSFYQQQQLRRLLQRWQVLLPDSELRSDQFDRLSNSRQVLAYLDQHLNMLSPSLGAEHA